MSITITLRQPIGISERGKRANNEDSIFPLQAQADNSLFIVCDGVGGAAKGAVASRLVCDTFAKVFQDIKMSESHFIETCLLEVEEVVEKYTLEHPESTGMATTLTLLHLHQNGVTVAHVGDSRIYQIRNGQIIYRSEDHSFVQDLVRTGIITPEEAATHPKRNVITRAIQGRQHPTKADVFVLQDIQADDYFFLCSDGILESVKDNVLCQILTENIDNQNKIESIKVLCEARSRDNFSCYLIQIEAAIGAVDYATPQPPAYMNALPKADIAPEPITQRPASSPPQYEAYKSDSVTVIRPQQASKQSAENVSNEPKPDSVTVIRPQQASNSLDNTSQSQPSVRENRSEEIAPSSSKWTFILYALFLLAIVAGALWFVLKDE
jgi:PPM family protein phosphatase